MSTGDDVKSTGNKGIFFIDTQLLHTVNRAFSSHRNTQKVSIKNKNRNSTINNSNNIDDRPAELSLTI